MPAGPHKKPLMRALGEFFGHISRGVKTPLKPQGDPQVLRHEVQEESRDTPQGKVVLRRTTIEEIELRTPPPAP